ncbi:unnamed protein product [Chondrus crispus]|uniref:Uncharacterized protein n=1 Tax=Chondrus crispus TaxID=2769 RepID=R7QGI9_CHOCR|nr:unnamed protein product [Chondrus crispus]CDF36571.1 unnamed protein product [Chondrus crispus]|eukprot:XP_005716390.1 unnamed protein product [Chondrus crispus]
MRGSNGSRALRHKAPVRGWR